MLSEEPRQDNAFPYAESDVASLRALMSDERLGRYEVQAERDATKALQLYVWNTAVASAFYGPLQCCEVALRNAVHNRMTTHHGARWFDTESIMHGNELRMAREARANVERVGKEPTPGRIVAELSFAHWVGLFANAYDHTIWRVDLHHLFKSRPNRHDLFTDLDKLRTLRNRSIAHHEPIFQRRLFDDYIRIKTIVGGLSPAVCAWMEFHSRVVELLAMDPGDLERF